MAEAKYVTMAKLLFQGFDKNELFSKEEACEYAAMTFGSAVRANTWQALITHGFIQEEDNQYKLDHMPTTPTKKTAAVASRSERQGHGFVFEEYVESKYGVNRNDAQYTAKWDGSLNGIPVSIKTAKIGTDVEMADFRRNAENTEDFYLFVGFWEGEKTNIVDEHVLLIRGEEWHELFPTHFVQDFAEMLDNITNSHEDDAKWRDMIAEQKERWQEETQNLIRPRFKRDHKSQKRVQCAINNGDFFNYFVPKYEKEI